jgi:uncharacterized protein
MSEVIMMREYVSRNWVDWTALILVIIGAINWGLVGLAEWDIVTALFGETFARVIFVIVGIAGLYMIYYLYK